MGRATDIIRHAWSAFTSDPEVHRGPPPPSGGTYGGTYGPRPHLTRTRVSNERSIIASVFSTLSVDVSDVELRHAMTDNEGGYVSTVQDGLQYCLSQEANLDQAARALRRDVAMTMFDKGVAAVVPVETTGDPIVGDAYDIKTLRVGEITNWYPLHVTVRLYDDRDGVFKEITLPKRVVAIVENPFYLIMNEPNSTLQRLIRKLNLMDVTDDKISSGKLDMIIQLPYTIKTEARRAEAEQRRNDIEFQLAGGKYGIAYADATEKITQLNRPLENSFLETISYLTKLLYSQLGLTEEIMNGTADENAMTNYMARTIEPIVDAVCEEFHRKFLSKTARTQKHKIMYFRDPFKLIPITRIAEIADVLSRNEIATPNDVRKAIGWIPSQDPKAAALNNSNMPDKPAEPAVSSRFISTMPQPNPSAVKALSTMRGDSQNGTNPQG